MPAFCLGRVPEAEALGELEKHEWNACAKNKSKINTEPFPIDIELKPFSTVTSLIPTPLLSTILT